MSADYSTTSLLPLCYDPTPLRQDSTLTDQEKITQWALFECLAAAQIADTKDAAWALMRETREHASRLNLFTEAFAALYEACATHLVWYFSSRDTEYSSYPRFEEALAQLLPGAKIVSPPRKHTLRPDFFVERDGLISCVEIKKGSFNQSAIRQLARYMEAYKLSTGYAVAPKLTGMLQHGMMFLQWPTKEG
jgi:hypothetical protein